ncbi:MULTISPECIES: acyl carrier protein [unclassified Streptomyces]|uniref:acyl carrier protein n=1 Tax=unclassified Streptomyces TaxID=2593676 RepID=UPI0004BFE950|nr:MULTISPECIES: acyl carrier protein [unclassified Streptomyces]KOV94557.1 polyketide-8 synthase acyl carrier protein [Streptomyces sp. NRRL B-3648]
MSQTLQVQRLEELRELAAAALEIEPEELGDDDRFIEDHDGDSLRAIELLARIEKKYKIELPQSELPNMTSLTAVYQVVARVANWQD